MTAQPGLCWTCSETPKTGFLRTRLILSSFHTSSSWSMAMKEVVSTVEFIFIIVLKLSVHKMCLTLLFFYTFNELKVVLDCFNHADRQFLWSFFFYLNIRAWF